MHIMSSLDKTQILHNLIKRTMGLNYNDYGVCLTRTSQLRKFAFSKPPLAVEQGSGIPESNTLALAFP